jgi:hypothetical protein
LAARAASGDLQEMRGARGLVFKFVASTGSLLLEFMAAQLVPLLQRLLVLALV